MNNTMIENTDEQFADEGAGDQSSSSEAERMFTQAEVDEILKTRLSRDRKKAEKANAAALEEITAQREEAEKRAAEAESRFTDIEERERNLQAREQLLSCREYLHDNGLPAQLLDAIPADDLSEFTKRVNAIRPLLAPSEGKHFTAPLRDSDMMNFEEPDLKRAFLDTPDHVPVTEYSKPWYRS